MRELTFAKRLYEFFHAIDSYTTRGYPGEQNETLSKGFVRLRGTCSSLSGLHVLIAIQTLSKPFDAVRLDNLVWTPKPPQDMQEVGARILGALAEHAKVLNPTPHTLQPTPYTLHPTPYTLHPTPYSLHPTP